MWENADNPLCISPCPDESDGYLDDNLGKQLWYRGVVVVDVNN